MKHISAVVIAGIICIVMAAFAGYKFGKSTYKPKVKAKLPITGEHAIADDKCNRRRSGSIYFPGAFYDDDAMRAIGIFISDSSIKSITYGNWILEPIEGPFNWRIQRVKYIPELIDTGIFGYNHSLKISHEKNKLGNNLFVKNPLVY